jgi:hypothetical protein
VDYAGLFPPAGLGMPEAVECYARHRREPHAWVLGRFVVPAARLAEFERAWSALSPDARNSTPWPLSVLAAPPLDQAFDAIARFNARHAASGARVDTVELSPDVPVDAWRRAPVPGSVPLRVFAECLADANLGARLPPIRAAGGAAKIRTGGTTAEAIPTAPALARFIDACARLRLPFKATAGLHHPVRAQHALTYAADAPRATMHGFLNVFVAATLAHAEGLGAGHLAAILEESDPQAFTLEPSDIRWRAYRVEAARIAAAREFAVSFGSCSFDEPLRDLHTLGWL